MKLPLILSALFVLPLVAADGPQKGKKGNPAAKIAQAGLMIDRNKDGELGDKELNQMKERYEARAAKQKEKVLEKFDTNKDGQLDDSEKQAMKEQRDAKRKENQAKRKQKMLDKFDTNKDGQLDDSEKQAMKDARPGKKKGKGKKGPGKVNPGRIADKDKDGTLSDDELDRFEKVYEKVADKRFDDNKDGEIDDDESKDIKKAGRRQGKGPKGRR